MHVRETHPAAGLNPAAWHTAVYERAETLGLREVLTGLHGRSAPSADLYTAIPRAQTATVAEFAQYPERYSVAQRVQALFPEIPFFPDPFRQAFSNMTWRQGQRQYSPELPKTLATLQRVEQVAPTDEQCAALVADLGVFIFLQQELGKVENVLNTVTYGETVVQPAYWIALIESAQLACIAYSRAADVITEASPFPATSEYPQPVFLWRSVFHYWRPVTASVYGPTRRLQKNARRAALRHLCLGEYDQAVEQIRVFSQNLPLPHLEYFIECAQSE